ncbi:MAG TPA: hypothetical protein VFZ51_03790 [Woeseiaceae bacterium]
MRETPGGIRSVIIDSVSPPNSPMGDENSKFIRSLRLVFDQCAGDQRCHSAFPALEEDFFSVLDELEARPIELSMSECYTNPRRLTVIRSRAPRGA